MTTRPTISFSATAKFENDDGEAVVKYLAPDGTFTESKDAAVKFRLHASATMGERTRIEIRKHDLAGGYQDWADLTGAVSRGMMRMAGKLEKLIWPDGKPEAKGKERMEQIEAIDKAWRESDDIEIENLRGLQILQRRIDFMAAWDVLVVEAPEGWRNLSERDDGEMVFNAIWRSYDETMGAYEQGKQQPS